MCLRIGSKFEHWLNLENSNREYNRNLKQEIMKKKKEKKIKPAGPNPPVSAHLPFHFLPTRPMRTNALAFTDMWAPQHNLIPFGRAERYAHPRANASLVPLAHGPPSSDQSDLDSHPRPPLGQSLAGGPCTGSSSPFSLAAKSL